MPSPGTSRFISTACRSPSSSSTAGSPDAATSRSCATLRPATLATRTTCRAASLSRSRRTSSTSARSSGTQLPGSAAAPTSSSTKNALPSARRTIALSSFSRIALGERLAISNRTWSSPQRAELEPLDAAQPRPLGDLAAERVAAVQVVGAVRRHDRHRRLERPGEQEAEQVAGRLVGPVAVLDDQQHRGHRGSLLQQGVHRGEQVGPVEHLALDPAGGGRRRRSAASTRRPGWSRASDGCASATRSTTSGSSAWSRPSTSENGR